MIESNCSSFIESLPIHLFTCFVLCIITVSISAESFSGKGMTIKGIRRHARGRMGEVRHQYCHYLVRLEEGKPPTDYYKRNPLTPQEQLQNWLEQMRKRKIVNSY